MSASSDRMRDDRGWLERVADVIKPGDTLYRMSVEDDDKHVENASDDDFPDEPPPVERDEGI